MQVTFTMPSTGLGYFPGLAKPVLIETDQLPEPEAQELVTLVAAARFFERPAGAGMAASGTGADRRHCVVIIQQGDRHRELQVGEPIDDPDLQRLVRFLEAQAATQRARLRSHRSL